MSSFECNVLTAYQTARFKDNVLLCLLTIWKIHTVCILHIYSVFFSMNYAETAWRTRLSCLKIVGDCFKINQVNTYLGSYDKTLEDALASKNV